MAVRDDRGDVKQTTTGFRDPRHLIYQKQIPIPETGIRWKMMSSFSRDNDELEVNYSIYSRLPHGIENLEKRVKKIKQVKKVSLLSPEANLYI